MPVTPEGRVKTKIKKYLSEEGVFFYMPVPTGFGSVGIPDILCCAPVKITEDMVGKTIGAFMGVECKAPGKIKNTTPNQKAMLADIYWAGGVAVVADDTGIVKNALEALRKGEVTYYVPK